MARQAKYFLGDQGFTNKREYNNAIAAEQLSDSGKIKLVKLAEKAVARVMEKTGVDIDKATKVVNIGFRNSQYKKLNQTLQATVEALTVKGYIEMVLFSHTGGGGVVANARTVLYRKDFSEEGLAILSDNVVDMNKEERIEMAIATSPAESNIEFIITDDIDVADSLQK